MEAPSASAPPGVDELQFGAQGLGSKFWTLIAATFLAFLGIGTVLPSMALHVRHDLGGSDQTVGFVIGTFSAVALISRFISGPLADQKGRKVAFLTGLASCAAAGLAYVLPLGLAGAYLGRGLQGFGEACLYTGAAAWAVETAGIHRSGRALGFVSTGIWGGISAGPLAGQFLGTFERGAALQVIFAILAFVLLSRVSENYTPHPEKRPRFWLPKSLIPPGLAVGFVNIHYPVVAGFLILHLTQHGGAGPIAFSAYASMVLLSRFFLGGLPDRVPPAVTFYAGLSAMAIGITIIAFTTGPIVSVIGAATLGLGFSFPWASIASTVMKQTPSRQRGSAVGVLSAFYDLFVGTSSFAAGVLASHFGYRTAFLLALAGVLVAAVAGRGVFRGNFRIED
jgi:MFS family permease